MNIVDIVSNKPTENWIDGYPMGNGDIGVMLFGKPDCLKFSLNKSDIWDNRIYNNESNHAGLNYKELEEIVLNKDQERYNDYNKKGWEIYRKNSRTPSFQPAGMLEIEGLPGQNIEFYRQRLSLNEGICTAEWFDKTGKYSISCITNAEYEVFAAKIKFYGETAVNLRLKLFRLPTELYENPVFQKCAVNRGSMAFTYPDGLSFKAGLHVDGDVSDILMEDNALTICLNTAQSGEAVLYLSIVSSNDGDNIDSILTERLNAASACGYGRLKLSQRKWWSSFWDKSWIELEDKSIEKLWYFGLYVLASSSRAGKQAPGLQGLWNIDYCPAWNGDYHGDLNIQFIYQPVYATNHLELAEPYYRLYKDMIPQVKKDTKKVFNCNGVKYPIACGKEGKEIGGYLTVTFWPGISAWIAYYYWQHYLYSGDIGFLKDSAYPVIKECILFYNDFLKKDSTGKYYIFPTISPEQCEGDLEAFGKNSAIDIAFIKELYKAGAQMFEILDTDTEILAECREKLDNFPEYPIKDGYVIDMEDREFTESHRHFSVLSFIYPVGEICLNNSIGMEVAKKTLQTTVGKGPGNYFGFSFPWLAAAASRLGLGCDALGFIHDFIDVYIGDNLFNFSFDYKKKGKGIYDSTMIAQSLEPKVMQIESNTIVTAAITEMLLQGVGKKIRVFPAIPYTWTMAKFKTLRTEGGFLVSSEFMEGKVKYIEIESTIGGKCTLVKPEYDKTYSVIETHTKSEIKYVEEHECISFMTKAGMKYKIQG